MARLAALAASCFAASWLLQGCGTGGSSSTPPSHAKRPVASRDAFVHLFEWRWSDVALECEAFLGPKGFTAVQVSPPTDHISGEQWWTRYQPVTYELVSRSGDEDAFADMVRRCNRAGVGIYVDAVINHVAAGSGTSITGKSFGNRSTPIFSAEDMHHTEGDVSSNCEISDYTDKRNVQRCDLLGMPDLCTSCENVQKTVAGYLNRLSDLGVAGFRFDAAKHQDAGELGQLLSRADHAADNSLFRFHEVTAGQNEAVTPDMYTSIGDVTEFSYSAQLVPNIQQEGKLQYLSSFGESWGLIASDSAVVFIDNHDTQRGADALTYKNGDLYQLASIFMLAHPYGYPKVMSSYYFEDYDEGPPARHVNQAGGVACGSGQPWVCEHRWPALANMVAWRRSAGAAGVEAFQKSTAKANSIAFCRGGTACVALNRGAKAWSAVVNLTVPAGSYCNVAVSDDAATCPAIAVSSDGSAAVKVPPLGAVAIHMGKMAKNEAVVSI